jgi:hypothetical protein
MYLATILTEMSRAFATSAYDCSSSPHGDEDPAARGRQRGQRVVVQRGVLPLQPLRFRVHPGAWARLELAQVLGVACRGAFVSPTEIDATSSDQHPDIAPELKPGRLLPLFLVLSLPLPLPFLRLVVVVCGVVLQCRHYSPRVE